MCLMWASSEFQSHIKYKGRVYQFFKAASHGLLNQTISCRNNLPLDSHFFGLCMHACDFPCRGQPGTVNWPEMGDRGDRLEDVSLGKDIYT
jgi:hypothetical protein